MSNTPALKAVFFDLDGTLVDSLKDLHTAVNLMLSEHDGVPATLEQVRSWVGQGAHALVEAALRNQLHHYQGTAEELTEQLNTATQTFFNYYAQCNGKLACLYPGVMDCLTSLHKHNVLMCLITNKPTQFTPSLLSQFNIAHYFTLVLCGDSLEHKKPHPAQLQHALDHYQLAASQVLMVGDSSYDIDAANALEMPCAHARYGYQKTLNAQCMPTYRIDNIRQLNPLIFKQQ